MTTPWYKIPEPTDNAHGDSDDHLTPDEMGIAREIQTIFLNRVNLAALLALDVGKRRQQIENEIQRILDERKIQLQRRQYSAIARFILDNALGYGPLTTLVADPTITEIMVNGANVIFVERHGALEQAQSVQFYDEAHLRDLIDHIVSRVGRRIDEASPRVDARLQDGSRVNVIIPPLSLDGPILTIRKFQHRPFSLDDLIDRGALSLEMAEFLRAAVCARQSIVVSGGTGSGKTTLLNALAACLNDCDISGSKAEPRERIITIEDSAELQFHKQYGHVVRMEARPPNVQGSGEITIRELVRNALRMRPDRIIVGEVRGSETLDMIQAMNTGHEGSLTTVHANSPDGAIKRIETMALSAEGAANLPLSAIREQIVNAIDLIVQTERSRDGQRRIVAISEVQELRRGDVILKDIFRYFDFHDAVTAGNRSGLFDATGVTPLCAEKLRLRRSSAVPVYRSHLIDRYLSRWLEDDRVSEIMINGIDEIYIERDGMLEHLDTLSFESEGQLVALIETIIAPLGRRIDERHPMVDARLPDGSRVNAVIRPVSQIGPTLTIRRFPKTPLDIGRLIAGGSLNQEMADFLRACVESRLNILVSGGTGSGKTTLLNILSRYVPADDRIITIEDVAELRLSQEHWINLESRNADEYGEGEVTIRDLVRNALRMRPDRIIVGEVRGAEALDMLQAMNTGHEGSMTTVHANTPLDAFSRLETMVAWAGVDLPAQAVRAQIVGALDIIVQTGRIGSGQRKILSIAGVLKDRTQLSTFDLYSYTGDSTDSPEESFAQQPIDAAILARLAPGVQRLWRKQMEGS